MEIYPSFYDFFVCKADKCTDTCCAGWEVDVDPYTYELYNSLDDDFGKIIVNNITVKDGVPSFKLTDDDRCVFLEKSGLCSIYTNLGEDFLCDICARHPRFYNEYDEVTEIGLGLCCERVCELLFDENYELLFEHNINPDLLSDENRERFIERTEILNCFRMNSLEAAVSFALKKNMLNYAEKESVFRLFVDSLMKTEPINSRWSSDIAKIYENLDKILSARFVCDEKIYSKLASYVIYRHYFNNPEGSIKAAVCAMIFLYCKSALCVMQNGKLTLSDIIDSVKQWSQQIEYSEENTEICLTIGL